MYKKPETAGLEEAVTKALFSQYAARRDYYFYWKGKGKKGYGERLDFGVNAHPIQAAVIVGMSTNATECSRTYELDISNVQTVDFVSHNTKTFVLILFTVALLLLLILEARATLKTRC